MSLNDCKEHIRASIVVFPEIEAGNKIRFNPANSLISSDNKISFTSIISLLRTDKLQGCLYVYLAKCVNDDGVQAECSDENRNIMVLKLDTLLLSELDNGDAMCFEKNKFLFSKNLFFKYKNTICSSYRGVLIKGPGEYTVVVNFKAENADREIILATWSFVVK